MLVYGTIGDSNKPNNTDFEFVNELMRLEAQYDIINIRINSPGGDFFQGLAIYNAIKRSKKQIDTYCDGVAGSAASIIFVAGKTRYINSNGMVLTHKASTLGFGNADDMEQQLQLLKEADKKIAVIYSQETGCSIEQAYERFLDGGDHMFHGAEAVAIGLANKTFDNGNKANAKALGEKAIANAIWAFYDGALGIGNAGTVNQRFTDDVNEKNAVHAGNGVYYIPSTNNETHLSAAPPKPDPVTIPKELYLSWDELMGPGNKMEKMIENNYTLFAAKFKEKFGKFPKGKEDKINHSLAAEYEKALKAHRLNELNAMDFHTLAQKDLLTELQSLDASIYEYKKVQYRQSR